MGNWEVPACSAFVRYSQALESRASGVADHPKTFSLGAPVLSIRAYQLDSMPVLRTTKLMIS
jgi:hypothetical protein